MLRLAQNLSSERIRNEVQFCNCAELNTGFKISVSLETEIVDLAWQSVSHGYLLFLPHEFSKLFIINKRHSL